MGILTWIVLGLIAGAIAKYLMPGTGPTSWVVTLVLGMFGAAVGGFIAIIAGFGGINDLKLGSLLLAVLGSMLVLSGYRVIAKYAKL